MQGKAESEALESPLRTKLISWKNFGTRGRVLAPSLIQLTPNSLPANTRPLFRYIVAARSCMWRGKAILQRSTDCGPESPRRVKWGFSPVEHPIHKNHAGLRVLGIFQCGKLMLSSRSLYRGSFRMLSIIGSAISQLTSQHRWLTAALIRGNARSGSPRRT